MMHPQSSKIPTDSSHAESERVDRPFILTINGGSSSLKFALFALTDGLERLLLGRVERIGMPGTRLIMAEAGCEQEDSEVKATNQAAVVHGDDRFFRPELVTLGVSETSHDLRDLLASQDLDVRVAEAVALFCYRAKTWLGALAAARRS
jgi:acetate kinase